MQNYRNRVYILEPMGNFVELRLTSKRFLVVELLYNSMRLKLVFFSILFTLGISAQENRLLVLGKIISARDSSVLDHVSVDCSSPRRHAVSGKNGHYALLLDYKPGQVIVYQMLGYETVTRTITAAMLARANGDTLYLNVVMQSSEFMLRPADIVGKRSSPDTVIGNWRFFIEDYVFLNDSQFILLTFEKTLKKAQVRLADHKEKILGACAINGEAIELYRDYQGHINVLCRDSAFRVKIVPPATVLLLALPYRDFCARMLPCVDTLGGKILFSNYHRDYPAFSYFAFKPGDTTVQRVRTVADKELLDQYNWEFDFLKPKDRLYARKMEAWTGIDKRMIAATMTGFANSIYYTPLYAPMYVVHDTICVFDHYADTLFLYDSEMNRIGASKISYHHPKDWKEWDRAIIRDEVTGAIYARFEKDGYYTLKQIDIKTGKISGEYRLVNRYVKRIRVRNGYVYYVYQPFDSLQKKYLYREQIVFKSQAGT